MSEPQEEPIGIAGVKNLAMEMLGPIHSNSFEFRAGVIMLAIIQVGTKEEKIAEFTGYSLKRGIIQKVLRNMVSSGILNEEKNALRVDWLGKYDESEDKTENQVVAFVMDCMTIAGHFIRSEENGELFYKMSDKAITSVEEMNA